MKKLLLSILTITVLAITMMVFFSCSSTQQESSLAESGEQESTASESSAPAENVPDTFTQGDHVFTRIHKNLYRVKKDRDLQPEIFWLWEAGTDIPKEFPDDEAYYGECELDDNHSLYYRPATLKNDTNLVFHNHETGGLNYAFARACDLLQGGAVQCYFESNKGILEIFGDFYDYDGNFLGSYGLSSNFLIINTQQNNKYDKYAFVDETYEKRIGYRLENGALVVEDILPTRTTAQIKDQVTGELTEVEVFREEYVYEQGSNSEGTYMRKYLNGGYYFRINGKEYGKTLTSGKVKFADNINYGWSYILYNYSDTYGTAALLIDGELKTFDGVGELMIIGESSPVFFASESPEPNYPTSSYITRLYDFKGNVVYTTTREDDCMIIFNPRDFYNYKNGISTGDFNIIVMKHDGTARSALLSDYVDKSVWEPVAEPFAP